MINRSELKRLKRLGQTPIKLAPIQPTILLGRPVHGYCVKCRSSRKMVSPRLVKLKNNRPAAQGLCPACGTKMFRIGRC